MKPIFTPLTNRGIFRILICFILMSCSFVACRKTDHFSSDFNNSASRYSADVINKWIDMQLRLNRDAVGIANPYFLRYYVYTGIGAFEALAPGTDLDKFSDGLWNGLDNLPKAEKFKKYYWPASVNASLASLHRSLYPAASTADKAAIDSLENVLNTAFLNTENPDVVNRSNDFGKAVADAVFSWSETDGYKNAQAAYTPPIGPGLWEPTPPAMAIASVPYWGDLRPVVAGSGDNTQPGPPIPYSTDPGSDFFKMVKHVYDVSQTLTHADSAWALFWRDLPGVSTGGHWLSILKQVLVQTNTRLDKAAFAYAITGACFNDAGISVFKTKYTYNLVRPITYIRGVMGFTTWNSVLTTPAHPEYPSAHAVVSSAIAEAFTILFGNIGSFTDHTWDYLGFEPRTFDSFRAIAVDAANSRIPAGIHYQPSADIGLIQGRKVAANILRQLGPHTEIHK
jgi:hypothetical protein